MVGTMYNVMYEDVMVKTTTLNARLENSWGKKEKNGWGCSII